MSRTPFSRLRRAWLRLAERNVERLEEQGVLKDGKPYPEYANAGMLNLAYVAGLGGLLYIGAGIHFLAMCLLLSLGLGVATVFVWRSGAVPPCVGRGHGVGRRRRRGWVAEGALRGDAKKRAPNGFPSGARERRRPSYGTAVTD